MSSRLELGSDGWPILLSDEPLPEDPEVARRALDEEVATRAQTRQAALDPAWQPSGDENFDSMVREERLELLADLVVQQEVGRPRSQVRYKAPRGFATQAIGALDDDAKDDLRRRIAARGLSERDAAIAANV